MKNFLYFLIPVVAVAVVSNLFSAALLANLYTAALLANFFLAALFFFTTTKQSNPTKPPFLYWRRFSELWLTKSVQEGVNALICDFQDEIKQAIKDGDLNKAQARRIVGYIYLTVHLALSLVSWVLNPISSIFKNLK